MRSDTLLRPYGVQLFDLLMDSKDDTFNDTVNSFVGIAAIQVHSLLCKNVPHAWFQRKIFTVVCWVIFFLTSCVGLYDTVWTKHSQVPCG